jgi:hypothetical protein
VVATKRIKVSEMIDMIRGESNEKQ